MTVKNALEILDGYISKKTELKIGLVEKFSSWNAGDDCTKTSKRVGRFSRN